MNNRIYFLILLWTAFSSCQHFDSGKPDTDSNRKRLEEYLEIGLTRDVNHIYCDGDLGPDYSVLFSFNCDSSTVGRIIKKKNLRISREYDDGLFFSEEFSWWNKEKIAEIKPYVNIKRGKLSQYLWYDKKANKAYYQELGF
ncbi:hypothetical protein [Desertivirga brevis]|uniref:hypothetical protein n=1 Tax=Desertivirga brevis TaxID=2810310 RepID=UPI001A963821|nr:hypothetical protein [Pedobacter sp. SYSU D00873]